MAPWAWEESRVWAEPGRPSQRPPAVPAGAVRDEPCMPTCVHERSPRTASSSETSLPEDP